MKEYQGVLVRLIKSGRLGIIAHRSKMINGKHVVFLLKDDLTPDIDEKGKRRKALASMISFEVMGYTD